MFDLAKIILGAVLLTLPRIAIADDARQVALAAGFNRTGLQLVQALAETPDNLVISPYGIGSALAMVELGASGKTLAEMQTVLGRKFKTVDASGLEKALTNRAKQAGATLAVANALLLTQNGDVIAKAYRDTLTTGLSAQIIEGSDLAAVNAWASVKTNGKIGAMLEWLDPNSVAVLLNAVHFKSAWQTPFVKKQTAPAAFRLMSGEIVQAQTMHVTGDFSTAETERFVALLLPFLGGTQAMVVLLPAKPDDDPATLLNPDTFTAALKLLAEKSSNKTLVSLPKFALTYKSDLVEPLKKLGLKRMFDGSRAQFSAMTGDKKGHKPIYVSQVSHKSVFEIDEAGAEGTAGTAVEMVMRSVASVPSFSADRPFAFFVYDVSSKAILFAGRVADPT